MRCPYCDSADSRVSDTTTDPVNDEIRRRRVCQACGERFSTIERVRPTLPLVIKESTADTRHRREPFDLDKLHRGIRRACAKRPISDAAITRMISNIEAELRAESAGEVSSRRIGELVIDALRDLDEIAYIRYAIVFLGLDDLAAVRNEIDRLLQERNRQSHPTR